MLSANLKLLPYPTDKDLDWIVEGEIMKPKNRTITVISLALIALFASGCLQKKTNKKTTTSSVSNPINNPYNPFPTPTVTPTDPPQNSPPPGEYADLEGNPLVSVDCTIIKPGGLSQYCIQAPRAVSKGCGNIGNGNSCPTPTAWNSASWSGNAELSTDSELNIRVVPRPAPSQGTATTNGGGTCGYIGMPYTTLSMTVEIKPSATSSAYASFTFERIPVNKPSYPYHFPVPPGITGPVVVQVTNIKWDCPVAGNCGTDPTRPMEAVWHTECVAFDVQFSTDNTRSWNRPIIY